MSWILQAMGKDGRQGHSGNRARLWMGRNGLPDCPFTLPGVREEGIAPPAEETSGHHKIPRRKKEGLGIGGRQVSHPHPPGLTIMQQGGTSYTHMECQGVEGPLENPTEACPDRAPTERGSRDDVCLPEVDLRRPLPTFLGPEDHIGPDLSLHL